MWHLPALLLSSGPASYGFVKHENKLAEQVVTHQPATSFSNSNHFPFTRAGGRTSNVSEENVSEAHRKIQPQEGRRRILPHLRPDQVDWDYENVYEWAYVDLPELSFTLDVTRDHGMSDVDDDVVDGLTPEEIEALPTAGPTYIFGLDRRSDSYVLDLADELIQRISDSVQSEILIFPGRINVDQADPEPIGRTKPRR